VPAVVYSLRSCQSWEKLVSFSHTLHWSVFVFRRTSCFQACGLLPPLPPSPDPPFATDDIYANHLEVFDSRRRGRVRPASPLLWCPKLPDGMSSPVSFLASPRLFPRPEAHSIPSSRLLSLPRLLFLPYTKTPRAGPTAFRTLFTPGWIQYLRSLKTLSFLERLCEQILPPPLFPPCTDKHSPVGGVREYEPPR